MNKKIEIDLFRYGNLLFGKVLYMDESLRGTDVLYTQINASVGMWFSRCLTPELIQYI